MSLRTTALATFLVLLPVVSRAQRQVFAVDPAKSQVQFSLDATMHAVHGTFHVDRGEITFATDSDTLSGVIAIDARSGNSGEASRDKRMTNDELKANSFGTVSFVPRSLTGHLAPEGDSTVVVQGIFTLVGTPHEITVPMRIRIAHGACEATGAFDVPFVKWGLKDPSTFMLHVGKDVTVNLDLVGSVHAASGE